MMWQLVTLFRTFKLNIVRYSCNMSASKRIAVCQMTSVANKNENLSVVGDLIKNASKENVQMIFFPEACDYICDNKNDSIAQAQTLLSSDSVAMYRQLAEENKVWLSMGGIHEKDENSSRVFNTHIIINDKGEIVQTYRKLHLFDVEIPEKNVRLKESDFTSPGGHIVTPVDTPVGKVGLAICYDLRFPELSTALGILRADILTYPSAFTQATGEAHWHVLLRARAIENQCYVIAAAQSGQHNKKRKSYGHALCVNPWGKVLADCGTESPCYKIAEINSEEQKDVRRNMPVFEHRRKDIYSLYTLSLRNEILPEHTMKKPPTVSKIPEESINEPTFVFGHVRVPESCVFYKSQLTYAFVNLRCVTPGHVLIAPIREAERNRDLTDAEAVDFYRTVRLVQNLMEKVHNTNSCTVTIQDGADAGQTVKHLHCHVMPRKKGDFIQKNHIYLELAKHDKVKAGFSMKPPRSLEEMRSEARFLRKEMEKYLETCDR